MPNMYEIISNSGTALSILTGLIGLILSILSSTLMSILHNRIHKKEEQQDIVSEINNIADILTTSSKKIMHIEKELENRIEKVNSLKTEAENAEKFISLTKEQVTAIQSAINQELKKDSKKSFWKSVVVNFVFFILGAAVSFGISYFFAIKTIAQ